MNYIFDNDHTYTKKCETETCRNEIFVGFSHQYCRQCLGMQRDEDLRDFKLIPHFDQRFRQ